MFVGALPGALQNDGGTGGARAVRSLSCGERELDRVAQDVGVTRGELCILAGKWPDSAEQLTQRMDRIGLDEADVAATEPQVMRDLQRACSSCASRRRCARDLAQNSSDPVWRYYCPNATTFAALLAERQRV